MEPTTSPQEKQKNQKPTVYIVTIENSETKEVVAKYASDVLIAAGVMKPVNDVDQVPVSLFHLGTPMQLNNLLAFINQTIMPIVLGLKKQTPPDTDKLEGKN